jgi:hypothetical protein
MALSVLCPGAIRTPILTGFAAQRRGNGVNVRVGIPLLCFRTTCDTCLPSVRYLSHIGAKWAAEHIPVEHLDASHREGEPWRLRIRAAEKRCLRTPVTG